VTGIAPQYQVLSLYRSMDAAESGGAPIANLSNEDATLESYGVQEMYCIKVSSCCSYCQLRSACATS
jgi:tubulin-folding cofactor B